MRSIQSLLLPVAVASLALSAISHPASAQFGKLGSIISSVSDTRELATAALAAKSAVEAIKAAHQMTNPWGGTYWVTMSYGDDTASLFVRTPENAQLPLFGSTGPAAAPKSYGVMVFGYAHADTTELPHDPANWTKAKMKEGGIALFVASARDTARAAGTWSIAATVMGDTAMNSTAGRMSRMLLRSGAFDFQRLVSRCRDAAKQANDEARKVGQPPMCNEKARVPLIEQGSAPLTGTLTIAPNGAAQFEESVATEHGVLRLVGTRVSLTMAGRTTGLF